MSIENNDLLDGFFSECEAREFSTAKHYRRTIRRFLEYLSKHWWNILDIDKPELRDYLLYLRNERKLTRPSVQGEFVIINAFFDYLEGEGKIQLNPVPRFRKKYLKPRGTNSNSQRRQLISVQDASRLVGTTLDTRDRAIILLLLKTGIRRNELCSLDIDDVDIEKQKLVLKETAKRSNRTLYFDYECAESLSRWISARSFRKGVENPALFISHFGERLGGTAIAHIVEKHAMRCGLHNPKSEKIEDRFSPHCCRHWFTTHLIRNGMSRDFVKELRGDRMHEAIDIYHHIDHEELKRSYLALIPQLGV